VEPSPNRVDHLMFPCHSWARPTSLCADRCAVCSSSRLAPRA
jgi:hypothetical protein